MAVTRKENPNVEIRRKTEARIPKKKRFEFRISNLELPAKRAVIAERAFVAYLCVAARRQAQRLAQ